MYKKQKTGISVCYIILFLGVTTLHAQWGSDIRLTNDPSLSYTACNNTWCVAASGDMVHVVWHDYRDGGYGEIYYKRSTDGGTSWGADTRLTDNCETSGQSSVAVSGSNIHVVWYDERDGNREIYYKRSANGGTSWGADTRLTDDPEGSFSPSVAVSNLDVHVVWYDERDGNREIYYKRYHGGTEIEENSEPRNKNLENRLIASPNPCAYFTTIMGYEKEMFVLYDVSGKIIGIHRGDRVGNGLSAGVYFVRAMRGSSSLLRIVKVK